MISDQTKLRLYTAAASFKKLAPWNWMYDDNLFAVLNPNTGVRGYCCVLGNAGEFMGLAIYKGDAGLASYDDIMFAGEMGEESMEDAFGQDCLMVSFYDKKEFSKEKHDEVKRLKAPVEGNDGYPVFEDYSPGLYPWPIQTEEEAEFILFALEQAGEVAVRFRENAELLDKPDGKLDGMLLRTAVRAGDTYTWSDSWLEIEEYAIPPLPISANVPALLAATKGLAIRAKSAWLFTFFYLPNPVQDNPESRPFFPEMMIVLDLESGQIIGQGIFNVGQLPEMIQDSLTDTFTNAGFLPEQILVPYYEDFEILDHFLPSLGIILKEEPEVEPIAEGVKEMLFGAISEEQGNLGFSDN